MKLGKPIKVFIAIVLLLAILFFACRNSVLHWVFNKQTAHYKSAYHLNISATDVAFKGLTVVQINNLTILPDGRDTLATFRQVQVNVAVMKLLTGKVTFNSIVADGINITAYNSNERNNLTFFKRDTANKVANAVSTSTYLQRGVSVKDKVFTLLKTAFTVTDVNIGYQDSGYNEHLYMPELRYDLNQFTGQVINQAKADTFTLRGNVVKKNAHYTVLIQHKDSNDCYLPFLNKEHGIQCRFNSIDASLDVTTSGNEMKVTTQAAFNNLRVNYWRIANNEVVLPMAKFNGVLNIRDNEIEIDSASMFTLGGVNFSMFANYTNQPADAFTVYVHMPEVPSDTFFNSLPQGMFNTLKGISCTGTLAYDLQFSIDSRQPDSLIFESKLTRKDFRINHYGQENYARINEPFVYEAYSGGQMIRTINIGPQNPYYTPLAQISPYLPKCVMQSEDPSFMVHRGFIEEAFRESIAKNYKEHRFARGGSTMSMQLVKNVFLSRDKNIGRKVEEALIVYLIENLQLVSKERMLEVYLNIIEWGPNVYGIGEASRFYFNKRPAQLTLQESIFLAAIIPNPKFFKYQFDKQGDLRPYLANYFDVLKRRMAGKGWVSDSDTANLQPNVKLMGPAAQMVLPAEALPDNMFDNNDDE